MSSLSKLIQDIRQCQICSDQLPLGPRPVVSADIQSKIVIIGQAPGLKVHQSGIPWDDASGKNLRNWLGVDETSFYDAEKFAIIPMGFCYPGRGKSGDLPPMKICATTWHGLLFEAMAQSDLVLLIGQYAQDYYLPHAKHEKLTDKVRRFKDFLPKFLPLPHPSPRNNIWQAKNPWFQEEVIPFLRKQIDNILHEVED